MLTWISENAKWVIYIFIVGIIAGLLFMDMSALQLDNRPPVGTVDGEKLSNELFDARLRQIQSQQTGLSNEQVAQMREELFRSFVQRHLIEKLIAETKIKASVHEMKRDLRTDPPQGIDREPMFQTNEIFDFAKYEAWLADPETYNIPFMLEYENMLKTAKIPEKQLRLFINAGFQPSSLEAKHKILNRETKFELWNAQGIGRYFEEVSISENAVDSVFKAQRDSFFIADDLAKVRYVAIPIAPSERDVENTLEYAEMLLAQIKDGTDFGDIARNSSEDPGSATMGGELGDYGPRGRWVPEFDSTAFALDSGEISNPIRTQFGFHIIQSLGKRIEEKEDGEEEEQVKARHILLTINAASETIDSLEAILNDIKAEVDKGKKFDEVATAKGLEAKTSTWFKRGSEIPELGHVSGLSSYAFFNPLRPKEDSKTSDILQNPKWVVIFEKAGSLPAGSRDIEFARSRIEQNLKAKGRVDAIAEHLRTNLGRFAEITVLDSVSKTSIEKVTIDSATVSFEGFLPGLGYANTDLYRALSSAKEGEWSGPYTSNQNAVLIKVLSKNVPSEEALKAAMENELSVSWQFGAFSAFSDYMRNLEANAKVVNNLDLYYRE
ncbi:MAG: peptidylprolyl isomerase [Fibromonadaceae bacterium]|jgi:peptidyl-prolyl cis-trans isomerase D|nr:peptidylprolyl isomerase [Fibromonadaceae bacterium]